MNTPDLDSMEKMIGDAAIHPDDLPMTLQVEVVVHDAEVIAAICDHADGEERHRFVERALRIGVLALKNASGEVDAERIHRETERLVTTLTHQFQEHNRSVHDGVAEVLKRYFDPASGHFQDRVERLVKRDGELEQVLARHIGQQDSELCKTLAAHFGKESPLIQWLNPDKSRGLLAELNKTLAEQLQDQRDKVVKQFSLDNKEGALCRFLDELAGRQGTLSKDLKDQISDVVKQFSLDDENSALSRLVGNVTKAEHRITSEFSLDNENSALTKLRRELLALLTDQQKAVRDFQEEVKVAIADLTARRAEAAASTRHGLAFEEEVSRQIELESQKLGDIASRTGNTTGSIKNCKVGDVVIELGPDSAAPQAQIVVEAKEDASYTIAKAREEIETARKNRNAQVGLFVFSAKAAPSGLEPVARFRNDVLVTWDLENPLTDLFLRIGLTLARALCIRQHQHTESEKADFAAIEEAILEIEKQAGKLGEIETWTKTIENNCTKIRERVEASRKSLERQHNLLNNRIGDLKKLVGRSDGPTVASH